MRGFAADEARGVAHQEALELCTVRTGQLVVEVESAVVREWPTEPGSLEKKKQPLLLTELRGPGAGTGTTETLPLVAPEGYGAGEPLSFLVGQRILVRPLRVLAGRSLTLRLAKNNRTAEPLWEAYAKRVGHATVGASAAVGLPAVPADALDVVFEMARRLTPDDRVLEWTTPIAELSQAVAREPRKALRLKLTTSRTVAGGPAGELTLLVFVEPEPGCP
jgi:hypothetical protein